MITNNWSDAGKYAGAGAMIIGFIGLSYGLEDAHGRNPSRERH